jgi:signal transduction histidine kinase
MRIPSRLIAAQEKERKRIGGELHDSIGQTLAALKYWVEMILLERDQGKFELALSRLEQFVPSLQRSIEETRAIYMGLRPTMLETLGVISTLTWFCREFQRIYPAHHIELSIGLAEDDIPEPLKIVIFRITQEALNNIAKHSRAEWVDITLGKGGTGIELSVADDGAGFGETGPQAEGRTLGLTGMRERAEATGGTLSIRSKPGEGTTIQCIWPAGAISD